MDETPNIASLTLNAILGAVTTLFNQEVRMTVFINLQDNHKTLPLFGVKSEKVSKSRNTPSDTAPVPVRHLPPGLSVTTEPFMPSTITHTAPELISSSDLITAPNTLQPEVLAAEQTDMDTVSTQHLVSLSVSTQPKELDQLPMTVSADVHTPSQLSRGPEGPLTNTLTESDKKAIKK